jgi:arylsulfatase A-like enzyme
MSHFGEFAGVIGRDWSDSTPWWPPVVKPADDAPNILVIVLDDVGFAQLGCYGSDISTPVIDGLANEGLRLANFHTTALCSPTRSCLLTGRNHHNNGMGRIADLAMGYPGYCGEIPKENGFLSEILSAEGYAALAVGKWHLTPEDETNMAALRWTWPLGRGFQRWYGFHGGETHQFVPSLYHDNHAVAPPRTIEQGYHLSADLADQAIHYIGDLRAVDVDQPFFMYFCTGACHSPHHAPREWIERYRGQFDQGWDIWRERTFARQLDMGLLPTGTALSERPPWVPSWGALEPEDQKVAARFMECFAAFLSYTDAQIGRLLDFLRSTDDLDNTLIMLVSDNGASSEGGKAGSINDARLANFDPSTPAELRQRIDELGGPSAHNNYPWGWTMAGNTPFKRWKREVHEGGVADPCIVHWPARLGASAGGIRHQFAHAIDVLPTVLELIGIEAPQEIAHVTQRPIDGTSFAYLLGVEGAIAPGQHVTQYFEMFGSRAIVHDGWKAVTFKPIGPMYDDGLSEDAPFDDDVWELYHVANDVSETVDLAESEPARLADMIDLWWQEAARHQVLPIDNRIRHAFLNPKPDRRRPRNRFTYYPNGSPVPETVAVDTRNRSHSISVTVTVPQGLIPEGTLLAQGSGLGGWSFHLLGGRLRYVHNLYAKERYVIGSATVIGPGDHELLFSYDRTGEHTGSARLLCDDIVVGQGVIPRFTPQAFNYHGAGISCGYELGPAVGEGYAAPFAFNALIHRAVVDVFERPTVDHEARFAAIMAEQ